MCKFQRLDDRLHEYRYMMTVGSGLRLHIHRTITMDIAIQNMHNARRVNITDNMNDTWIKDIYDNVVAKENVIYLVCEGDIMFVINRNDFASTHEYLVEGVRSSVLLAMGGNFSIYINDDKEDEIEDDVMKCSKLFQCLITDALCDSVQN